MSVRLTTKVWDLDLPSHLKLVLLAMADHGNDEGICWPSQGRIAKLCGIGERQARASMKELRNRGLLEIIRRRRNATPIYRLILDREEAAEMAGEAALEERAPASGPDLEDLGEELDRSGSELPSGEEASILQERKPASSRSGSQLPGNHQGIIMEPSEESSSLAIPSPSELIPSMKERRAIGWEALEDLFGYRPAKGEASLWGKLLEKILADAPDQISESAIPSEIRSRALTYFATWPKASLTPAALMRHWQWLGSPIARKRIGEEIQQQASQRADAEAIRDLIAARS